ncbi:MAG TPA: HDOD domain-containing protein [Candidatus Paceibacterota bacterium]|nr:HDOD domain-containing protein [Candidatus Paceibacterota bacterium]
MDKYIDSVKSLPPAPVLMVKLIECFRQPDHDMDEIVKMLAHDPPLTAELLRRCNQSLYGNDNPVTDVFDAVFRLGFYEVYTISMSIFGQQTMSMKQLETGINVAELWKHSAIAAVASGAIARKVSQSEGLAFTAGLLHDVGKIVFASAEGAEYAKIRQSVNGFGSELVAAETGRYGFNHSDVGRRLLMKWGMPMEIVSPVAGHHSTLWDAPHEKLSAVVALGDVLAHAVQGAPLESCCQLPEAVSATALLEMAPDGLPSLLEEIQGELERVQGFLPLG